MRNSRKSLPYPFLGLSVLLALGIRYMRSCHDACTFYSSARIESIWGIHLFLRFFLRARNRCPRYIENTELDCSYMHCFFDTKVVVKTGFESLRQGPYLDFAWLYHHTVKSKSEAFHFCCTHSLPAAKVAHWNRSGFGRLNSSKTQIMPPR